MGNRVKIKGNRTRVGNFIIEKFETGNERFEIRNAGGNFKLSIYLHHPSYDMIDHALEEGGESYLNTWLAAIWFTSTGVKDWKFFEELFDSVKAQADRLKGEVEPVSEEEDQAILENLKTDYEVEEQLKAIQEDETWKK